MQNALNGSLTRREAKNLDDLIQTWRMNLAVDDHGILSKSTRKSARFLSRLHLQVRGHL